MQLFIKRSELSFNWVWHLRTRNKKNQANKDRDTRQVFSQKSIQATIAVAAQVTIEKKTEEERVIEREIEIGRESVFTLALMIAVSIRTLKKKFLTGDLGNVF